MRRRDFLAAAAAAAAFCPPSRAAQAPDPEIGYLYAGSLGPNPESVQAFCEGLATSGYVAGRNVGIVYREADNDASRLPELALDLVHRNVDVINVPGSGPALLAAKAATATIPIVFSNAGDPLRLGFVTSLSRPGGNVTGISDFGNDLSPKRLELLKLLAPGVSLVGILVTRGYPGIAREAENARTGARALSIETTVSLVSNAQDIDAAFAAFVQAGVGGICVTPSPLFVGCRAQIATLAARYRLPAIYPFIQFPEVGGLMSYGTSLAERNYQAGRYVGLILGGARPGDLPVHRLSRFELVINMATARTLGLTVPAQLLAIADQVFE